MEQRLFRALQDWGALVAEAYLRNSGPKALTSEAEIARAVMSDLHAGLFSKQVLRPIYEQHYALVAGETLDTINQGLGLGVNLSDPAERRILAKGGTRAGLVDLTASTRKNVARLVADGRAAGNGPAAIARAIRDQVPAGRFVNAGPRYRSMLIARTETKFAQNAASLEVYKGAPGIGGVQAFDAQGSGETDDECQDRDGQIFSFADADMELASEHPGGTLSFAPVAA